MGWSSSRRKISHFILHLSNKSQSSSRRRKYHCQPGASQDTIATRAVRLPCRSGPQPKWSGGDCRNDADSVSWRTHETPMRIACNARARCGQGHSLHADNFVKGYINAYVANPKAKATVCGDVDISYQIIPKPSYQDEVSDRNSHYCSVSTNGNCTYQKEDENYLQNNDANLESCAEVHMSQVNNGVE